MHSHMYNVDSEVLIPAAKFSYDLSPIQIVVTPALESVLPLHYPTTCAIIGGVFTVAGILDGLFHASLRVAKKVELGKQT